jgi:hypothetical protein
LRPAHGGAVIARRTIRCFKAGTRASHIRPIFGQYYGDPWTCGFEVTGHQLELLQPAREQPWLLDDATVARIIRVHRDQADDLTLFQNQADRWKTASLTAAQQAAVDEYEAALAQLRQLNAQVLAVAAELARGTIETTLAKSDLELAVNPSASVP